MRRPACSAPPAGPAGDPVQYPATGPPAPGRAGMAEFSVRGLLSTRRALLVAAIGLAAAAVAAGAAVASSGGGGGPAASDGGGSVATATVVRTTLTDTVQEGGSIGYKGSYTIAAPSGTSASALSQQQQTVAADQLALSADEQAASDTA